MRLFIQLVVMIVPTIAALVASFAWTDDVKWWGYTILTPGFPEEGSLASDIVVITFSFVCFLGLYLLLVAVSAWIARTLFPKIDLSQSD